MEKKDYFTEIICYGYYYYRYTIVSDFEAKTARKGSRIMITYVDNRINEEDKNNLKTLAAKEDIHLLKQYILKPENKVSETKTDIIKRVFGFFITLVVLILGLNFRK